MTRVAVIGGGIAGVSAAYALLDLPDPPEVVLVEAEAQLALHSTGRSAAQFIENYGASAVRPLSVSSRRFFHDPPDGLTDSPLLHRRSMLMVATEEQATALDETLATARSSTTGTPSLIEISPDEALRHFPALRRERLHRVLFEPSSADIDVAALHQALVRGFRRRGGEIRTSTRVDAATADGAGWMVTTTQGTLGADIVVNTAGAWGDRVAATAGIEPIGLTPLRRTAFTVPADAPAADWSLVLDIEQRWYVKPDGSQFLCSPADETHSEPCDARPDEVDIALAIERINEATTIGIRSVASSWAGLRTFAPDRSMVIGPEPDRPSFVWCVGQGGTGIQTAPAAGRLTADLALTGTPGPWCTGLDLPALLPDRFR